MDVNPTPARITLRNPPRLSLAALPPGTRLGVAVSGGADSTALLRLVHEAAGCQGWTLLALHVQHGLRGEAGLADQAFVAALASLLSIPYRTLEADVAEVSHGRRIGVEEAGRLVRYSWFRQLLATGELSAIATGHTLDDQAETVLAKLLRGAWTGGLGGIHPVLPAADLPTTELQAAAPSEGVVVRPLLQVRRQELRDWLRANGQPWREDETNADPSFTRNRIRNQLLPALSTFNPQVEEQLAQISTLARDDERYWQAELDRLLPGLLLPGRPVRGGGRASSTLPGEQTIAIMIDRLRALHPALARRVLRATAAQLGVELSFAATRETLALLEGPVGSTARRAQLTPTLRAERTPRELRFVLSASAAIALNGPVEVPIPGIAESFGIRLHVSSLSENPQPAALLRSARPSDRVTLRYSGGAPKRVKEVLERLGIPAPDRAGWPVLEWQGELVWLRGAQLAPTPLSTQLTITEEPLQAEPPPATP